MTLGQCATVDPLHCAINFWRGMLAACRVQVYLFATNTTEYTSSTTLDQEHIRLRLECLEERVPCPVENNEAVLDMKRKRAFFWRFEEPLFRTRLAY